MSHTTTLRGTQIRDIRALRTAVQEMQASGINCELVENAKPRLWYANQHGECDFVLKLPECRFDVGFDRQADGSYLPVFDAHGGIVGTQIGATCPINTSTNEERVMRDLGQLLQGYAKNAAINAAVEQGYSVESASVDDKGSVHLSIVGGM